MIRKFLTCWKLARRLMRQTHRSVVYLKNPTQKDLLHLSIGRWEAFKAENAPEFTVRMTIDDECILKQYCLRQAYEKRTQGILSTFRPNASDALEATTLCIQHILNCQQREMSLASYLIELTAEVK